MSQPVPPNQPQQPYGGQPSGGNPYAGQAAQPGAPGGNPFAGQQPGQFGGAPFAPAPPARANLGLGILTAFGTALVAAVLYGVLAGSIEREIGYAAVGVGFLVGFAAAKVGGAHPALVAAGAVFSLGAVYLGQLVGMSMILADASGLSFSGVFFDHFGDVTKIWKEEADFMTYLFLALGPVAAIGGARKAG
ncbi:hypothetical protein [Streptomyces fulvorobeus]|uniref:Uncharacterized protein n=1 Tax=Streptomyces fulvorobeus TaxID=284028 RepID=A0A7J0C935_9ACTN|nr:hypothetical protein [Streptomyces fulvorobeus]NYE42479.1 hypothetical protein [Streptomyces fulvorobeus]GFM98878.1 hypothetical protein Sfulv_36890 [Streptomyces fulvorobeus]